jgi:flagellar basal-body rod modification protein FlgD
MATSTGGVGAINQDQFLQLLVAQLQNQDPMNPISNQDFIAQLTSLNTLQGVQSLDATFSEVLKLQQLTDGSNLIGKTVQYTAADGSTASGKVDSLNVQDGSFVLGIGATQVALDQITNVQS